MGGFAKRKCESFNPRSEIFSMSKSSSEPEENVAKSSARAPAGSSTLTPKATGAKPSWGGVAPLVRHHRVLSPLVPPPKELASLPLRPTTHQSADSEPNMTVTPSQLAKRQTVRRAAALRQRLRGPKP
ncbi:unnamed protein product [Fraxinus pennsylvanica]|uniref:Uncharacterized protein n=1 Tax=Fraxinus pennsylvanica TaxID=56036 RepID=A0AAD2DJA7_9LAMI|nr:unnamed protein product [Fraxinus pennsylvanica]